MIRKILTHVLATSLVVATVVTGHAEISGSGFRDISCSGEFTLNLFLDHNGDGIQSRNEEGFPKAELFLSLTHYPQAGEEKFTTDADGFVRINSLCKGVFTIEVDPATIPPGAVFEGIYEAGQLVVDPVMDDRTGISLSGGGNSAAPAMRYLDVAFGTVTRRMK